MSINSINALLNQKNYEQNYSNDGVNNDDKVTTIVKATYMSRSIAYKCTYTRSGMLYVIFSLKKKNVHKKCLYAEHKKIKT
jgi:hypothetical protein